KGELLGEALFGAAAARESDPDHAEKLRALRRIEADTASQRRPLVDAAEIPLGERDEETVRAQGREIGNAGIEWDVFVKGLHDALPAYLANFVRLRTLATDAGDPALVALVVH